MRGMTRLFLGVLLLVLSPGTCYTSENRYVLEPPTVVLDNGTFTGATEGSLSVFRGIPYAQPPSVRAVLSIYSGLTHSTVLATYVFDSQ